MNTNLIGSLVELVLTGLFAFGYMSYFLKLSRNEDVEVNELWSKTGMIGAFIVAAILMSLFTTLWSLLFIIPGIIAAYSYSMTLYILLDNPDMKVMDAIKKSKEILAFSTVFPDQKKTTKIMLCTLIDLNMEYEGIKDVNCYLIVVDLQKENSKEKLEEIFTYINSYCNLSKKVFILGVNEKEEETGIKISEEEIDQRINDLEYDYLELNLDNDNDVTGKITEIFNYCSKNSDNETNIRNINNAHSCSIY